MKCPYCGKEHPADAKFCPIAGKPIVMAEKAVEEARCPNCGKPVLPAWSHCVHCGVPLKRPGAKLPLEVRRLVIPAALGVFLLVLVVVFFLFNQDREGGKKGVVGGSNLTVTETPAARAAAPEVEATETLMPTFTPAFTLTPPPSPSPTPSEAPSLTPTLTHTPTAALSGPWEACRGSYLSRLRVNDYAVVSSNPNLANRVRSGAGTSNELIGYIKPGEKVKILEGPTCAANWVWWRVRSERTGLTGWTSEGDEENYWLVPASQQP